LATHLRLDLPSGPFPSAFPPISYMQSCSPLFVLRALPISSSLTWSFWLCMLRVQVMKCLIMQFSPTACHFI
jgi:hypothetical protein